ncbi:MAG: hypothetical protein NUV86_02215 [Candidatus Scalindua sp.]|nr:hypothetical protein [Candidatus Scalindua sp.]
MYNLRADSCLSCSNVIELRDLIFKCKKTNLFLECSDCLSASLLGECHCFKTYHDKKSTKFRKKHAFWSKCGWVLFSSSLVIAISHLFCHEKLLTVAAILLPALGAARGALRMHFEYNKIFRRSEQMVGHIDTLLEKCGYGGSKCNQSYISIIIL